MKWNLWKKQEHYIGLEFKDTVIKLVEIDKRDERTVLRNFHIEQIPQGLISGGKIQDEGEFGGFMLDVKNRAMLNGKNVHVSLDSQNVLLRPIRIPNIPEKEIKKALDLEIENNIQLPFANFISDYTILTSEKERKDAKELDVMLVIASRSHIHSYIKPLKEIGLLPLSVDLSPLAVQRVMALHPAEKPGETFMIVNIGEKNTEVSIVHKRVLRMIRTFALDVQSYIQNKSLKPADAEAFLTYREGHDGIHSFANDVGNELERILNFYMYTLNNRDQTVSELVLVGDIKDLQLVCEYLSLRLNVPARVEGLEGIEVHPELRMPLEEVAGSLVVPYGLAIKDVNAT